MPVTFTVPRTITVHLGAPDDDGAPDVTIPFVDYIKNVASSEIYPTWPENAIRANIYAQITYTLNRVFTEYYPARGYSFDITSSTQYDQSFTYGRDIFENISRIVDEIFNDYIVRQGRLDPIFARYCNGTTSACPGGLSQWGSVDLANQGYSPLEILRYYYGDDITLVTDAPVAEMTRSYPGTALRLGDSGADVNRIQLWLNRVSRNYPAIPKIAYPDGIFDLDTENAVLAFQRIFNLAEDGIVGKATWYRLYYMYTTVKRLSELDAEGVSLEAVSRQFRTQLAQGDRGDPVRLIQYFLCVIGEFNDFIPRPATDGIFGPATHRAVQAFQQSVGLPQTGIVDRETWDALYSQYTSDIAGLPEDFRDNGTAVYPGAVLRRGSSGDAVRILQTYLAKIADYDPAIPKPAVTGYFGQETENAVLAFQRQNGLAVRGVVGLRTWDAIADQYSDRSLGEERSAGQYPGVALAQSDS